MKFNILLTIVALSSGINSLIAQRESYAPARPGSNLSNIGSKVLSVGRKTVDFGRKVVDVANKGTKITKPTMWTKRYALSMTGPIKQVGSQRLSSAVSKKPLGKKLVGGGFKASSKVKRFLNWAGPPRTTIAKPVTKPVTKPVKPNSKTTAVPKSVKATSKRLRDFIAELL